MYCTSCRQFISPSFHEANAQRNHIAKAAAVPSILNVQIRRTGSNDQSLMACGFTARSIGHPSSSPAVSRPTVPKEKLREYCMSPPIHSSQQHHRPAPPRRPHSPAHFSTFPAPVKQRTTFPTASASAPRARPRRRQA